MKVSNVIVEQLIRYLVSLRNNGSGLVDLEICKDDESENEKEEDRNKLIIIPVDLVEDPLKRKKAPPKSPRDTRREAGILDPRVIGGDIHSLFLGLV